MNDADSTLRPYHHGDLRKALLAAGEAELAARGVEAFSLRAVAKRAGVSHAAPAHHFGDAGGLLTALATEGFREFLRTQGRREALAPPDATEQLLAAGMGYVDFALERPALFGLLFGSGRPDFCDPDLRQVAEAAYAHLVAQVDAAGGQGMTDILAARAVAHGLASLLSAAKLEAVAEMPLAAREALIEAVIRRVLPTQRTGPD